MKTKILPIYLDYMAATPLDPEVLAAMLPYFKDPLWCANASSTHHWLGQQAATVVEEAREQLASSVGAQAQELIWTSGATEANNLAIFGAAMSYQRQGKHLMTLRTEHKAVLNVFEELERRGFEVTYLTPAPSGILDFEEFKQHFRPDTILVSMMLVNNEIGVIQDVETFAAWTKSKGALFHVDAAQAMGRVPINLKHSKIDLMSFSSHKSYGPKGIGALYLRQKPKVRLHPLLFGGQQEQGLRPGTLPTPLIVGMAKAFELANVKRLEEEQRYLSYRNHLRQVLDTLGGMIWHGDWTKRVPGNLNFSILGVDASDLISNLYPLILSNQSACSAALNSASHVLLALGCDEYVARAAIRLSLGRMTTDAEIQKICDIMLSKIPQLRKMSDNDG